MLPSDINKKAVIIGGGIAGASVAYALLKRDWSVTIIERTAQLAMGSSGNTAGVLMPLIALAGDRLGEFYFAGFKYSLDILEKLSPKWSECGVLQIGEKSKKDFDKLCIEKEYRKKLSSIDIEKNFNFKTKSDGIFFEKGGWVSTKDFTNKLATGANFIFNTEAISLKFEKNIWNILNHNNQIIETSEIVIIANSYDAKQFEQTSWLPLQTTRGQITYIPEIKNAPNIIICDHGYNTPAIDGFHQIGATYDHNDNPLLSIDSHKENIRNSIFPDYEIKLDKLNGRVAFRCASIDRLSVVGKVPDYNLLSAIYKKSCRKIPVGNISEDKYLKGLFISTAHGSRGLTSAPISGEILALIINNESNKFTEKFADNLNPARFVRKLIQHEQL